MNKKPYPSVIFFGTPEFARYCLDYLVTAGFHIKAVVTAPDRKAGRGKKLTPSVVKQYALSQKLTVLQPTHLKNDLFIEQLSALEAELFVVVAFRMLPKAVWSLPALGTINLHASVLPNYRGAAPINWVLINGEKETGVSTFLIDEAIDAGLLLQTRTLPIDKKDNFGTLHDKLLHLGAPLLEETLLERKDQRLIPQKQDESKFVNAAPKLNTENTRIIWTHSLEQIVNQIRGLNPYPGAWTMLTNEGQDYRIKIYEAEALHEEVMHEIGQLVIRAGQLLISTAEGYLLCKEVQFPNKKRMRVKDLLNGFKLGTEAIIH